MLPGMGSTDDKRGEDGASDAEVASAETCLVEAAALDSNSASATSKPDELASGDTHLASDDGSGDTWLASSARASSLTPPTAVLPQQASDKTLPASGTTARKLADELAASTGRVTAAWKSSGAPDPFKPEARYHIEHEVARGGLGRVYLAEDRWLGRKIALKELRSGRSQAAPRFHREALITARLEHPAIVPVHDAGHWPGGEPFYSMKMVEGQSLAAAINATSSFGERLGLLGNVRAVCDAIAYAHDRRIIHRDLKPANVMVGEYGETLVIDWGLAKDLDAGEGDDAPEYSGASFAGASGNDMTVVGSVLGTPAYMSPEQADGADVDERTDVYALGAMLYSVLTGKPPYGGNNSGEVLTRVLEGKPIPLTTREPRVPPDLAAIVTKSMARDPDDRYPSAADLAADLERFTTGQLVRAHDYSLTTLIGRWVKRHRAVVTVAAAALTILVVFGAFAIRSIVNKERIAQEQKRVAVEQTAVAERERGVADQQRSTADDRADRITLLQAKSALSSDPTESLAWLKQVSDGDKYLHEMRAIAHQAVSAGVAMEVFHSREPVLRTAISADAKTVAAIWNGTDILLRDVDSGVNRVLSGDKEYLICVAFSPDGRQLAATTFTGGVLLWDLVSAEVRRLGQHSGPAWYVTFSPEGHFLASIGQDPSAFVWNLDSGHKVVLAAGATKVDDIRFSPDGRLVATSGEDGSVSLWKPASGDLVTSLRGGASGTTSIGFSPDGSQLGVGHRNGDLALWSLQQRSRVQLSGHEKTVTAIAFSPDGRRMASTGSEGGVRLHELATTRGRLLGSHSDQARGVAFSATADELFSWGYDGTIRGWNANTGASSALLRGHTPRIHDVSVASRKLMISGDNQGWLRIWTLSPPHTTTIAHTDRRGTFAISPNGQQLAHPGPAGVVAGTNLLTGQTGAKGGPDMTTAGQLAFSLNGTLISAGLDGGVRSWPPDRTEPRLLHQHTDPLTYLAVSPDGDHFAVRGPTDVVYLRSLDRTLDRTFGDRAMGFSGLAFSSEGKFVTSDVTGTLHIVALDDSSTTTLQGHTASIHAAVFSPNGSYLATCDRDAKALLWNLETSSYQLVSDGCRLGAPVFSADGDRVSFPDDDDITLFNISSGRATSLRGHEDTVRAMVFSPTGDFLVSGSMDHTLRVWDLKGGSCRVLAGHEGGVMKVALGLDGRVVVSASNNGDVRLWKEPFADSLPISSGEFSSWLVDTTSAGVAPAGRAESQQAQTSGSPARSD